MGFKKMVQNHILTPGKNHMELQIELEHSLLEREMLVIEQKYEDN